CDITIKAPRILNAYTEDLKKLVSASITRGKIDVYVSLDSLSNDDIKINVNSVLAEKYYETLVGIKRHLMLKDEISLATVTRLDDIISVEKAEEANDEIFVLVKYALMRALSGFDTMRKREGANIKADIGKKLDRIYDLSVQIKERTPQMLKEYREKLLARIKSALAEMSAADIDNGRVIMEAALFADKSCVDEEVTRLSSHVDQFRSIINDNGAIGKKLDFLVQEINREINTIGSKSNDIEITNIVLELKLETEKIREQIQNIE
ncbi:MAG: YicC family protein, partial [Clostridiales bacterium]|nr:YicC family protein [Clostridiales bacterium]